MSAAPSGQQVEGERVPNGRIVRLLRSDTAFLLPDTERALSAAGGAIANNLLAALPREDYRSLLGELEPVLLKCGEVLYQPGERIGHVYFPNDAQVSLLIVMADKALAVGLVGREGMVGISLALGSEISSVRVLVQGSGGALRMKAASFRDALGRSLPLQRELHRYANAKLVQARQIAACNRFHQVEARLAGWLLLTRERVRAEQFHFTHEFVAASLGIRRVGVTNAASALQRRQLIRYQRGNIRILDCKGLKAASCGCYEIVANLAS